MAVEEVLEARIGGFMSRRFGVARVCGDRSEVASMDCDVVWPGLGGGERLGALLADAGCLRLPGEIADALELSSRVELLLCGGVIVRVEPAGTPVDPERSVWRLEWARLGWRCRDALAAVVAVAAARLLGWTGELELVDGCRGMLADSLRGLLRPEGSVDLELEYRKALDPVAWGEDVCYRVCWDLKACLDWVAEATADLVVESGVASVAALVSGERLWGAVASRLVARGLAPEPPSGPWEEGLAGLDDDEEEYSDAESYIELWEAYCVRNPDSTPCRAQRMAAIYRDLAMLLQAARMAAARVECTLD